MNKLFFFFIIIFSQLSFAAPACKDKKETLQIDNSSILKYRDFMEKGFKVRALISGIVVKEIENRQGHTHLEIDLDQDLTTTDDRIEAVFSNQYGTLPTIQGGERTLICGDFIVDPYSPNKAIIHWLHQSPNTKKHDHGYMTINDQVYGM